MGTGYTRNDTSNNIADGNVINASDLDGEFDAVQAAFNATTGHSHDGTIGEGPKIDTAGLADDAVTGAKIDSTTTVTAASFVGPLTGDVTGNVSGTATQLATARTIGLSGDVSGSASFDGSANATITATVADDSHNHVISNVDGLQTALDGKQPLATVLTNTTASYTTAEETKLAGIETGATADQTAQEIATAIDADATAEATLKSALGLGTAAYTASGDYVATTGDSMTGSLSFGDNDRVRFGNSFDLQIYHSGTGSFITDTGTGSLYIQGSSLYFEDSSGNNYIDCTDTGTGGTVRLRHNTVEVLQTTPDGIDITSTGSVKLPNGTTAERPISPSSGDLRWNTDNTAAEIYDGSAWAAVGGGNTTTEGLYEMANTISANYSITSGNNAMSAGPITVNTGVSVTIPTGSTWTIV